VVIAALNLFWWFWAKSLLQHFPALGLVVVFGMALAWPARSRGVAGQVARELVDKTRMPAGRDRARETRVRKERDPGVGA
jgi:hypothetical protein